MKSMADESHWGHVNVSIEMDQKNHVASAERSIEGQVQVISKAAFLAYCASLWDASPWNTDGTTTK
jgi:hypothetical protein